MDEFDPSGLFDEEDEKPRKKKKKDKWYNRPIDNRPTPKSVGCGCLSLIIIILCIVLGTYGCERNRQRPYKELEEMRSEVVDLYISRLPAEERVAKLQEIIDKCDEEIDKYNEKGETQLKSELTRAYVCLRQMTIDVKRVALGEVTKEEVEPEYRAAQEELASIIKENGVR